jgi:integrase
VTAPQTFTHRTDAERWLAAQETDQARGVWVDPNLGQVRFEEWASQWLSSGHKRPSTLARDTHVVRAHLLPALGNRPLSTISPLDVRGLVEGMAEGLAPATVRTNYGVLRAILNASVEAELLARSPCRGIRLAPDEHREQPTRTPDDLKRLESAMPEQYEVMVPLGGVLGLRWSEVVALRVGRIDFLRSTITIAEAAPEVDGRPTPGNPKSKAGNRTIAVPPFVMDQLAQHLARRGLSAAHADALVFVSPGGGLLRASNFRNRVWGPAIRAAGLDGLTFHGLRHVATSLMVETGEHPRVVQHRLGHSTASLSMELYAHVSDDADRAAARRLEELFSLPRGTRGAQRAQGPS